MRSVCRALQVASAFLLLASRANVLCPIFHQTSSDLSLAKHHQKASGKALLGVLIWIYEQNRNGWAEEKADVNPNWFASGQPHHQSDLGEQEGA